MDASTFHRKSRAFKAKKKFMKRQKVSKKQSKKFEKRQKDEQEVKIELDKYKAQKQQEENAEQSDPEEISPINQLLATFGPLKRANGIKIAESESDDDDLLSDDDVTNEGRQGLEKESDQELEEDMSSEVEEMAFNEDVQIEDEEGEEEQIEDEAQDDDEEDDSNEEEEIEDEGQEGDNGDEWEDIEDVEDNEQTDNEAEIFDDNSVEGLDDNVDGNDVVINVHALEEMDPFMLHFQGKDNLELKQDVQILNWPKLGVMQVKSAVKVEVQDIVSLPLRSVLIEHIPQANEGPLDKNNITEDILTDKQKEIMSILSQYIDFYYPERTWQEAEEIRVAYCLHILNHVLKANAVVEENNATFKNTREATDEMRDRGLTNAKVLVLVPFRQVTAYIMVIFAKLLFAEGKSSVGNEDRFIEEFHSDVKRPSSKKDYEETFAGNIEDCFQIGISVKQNHLRPYVSFYEADIIIASPLGLKRALASKEGAGSFDFLSSIDVLVIDQTNVLFMQNWQHMLDVVQSLHLKPKHHHGVDFSRVRTSSLEGTANQYCQTIVISAVSIPAVNGLFNRQSKNRRGQIKVSNPIAPGSFMRVFASMPHFFHRFNATSPVNVPDARFEMFTKTILPKNKEGSLTHTLVFIPSYFDYVRLRNYLNKEDLGCTKLCEYMSEKQMIEERKTFASGQEEMMLITERSYFYYRYKLKGACHVIFYELPTHPQFYTELCNAVLRGNQDVSHFTCTVLYSKYDAQALSAVVGTEKAAYMINSSKKFHMIVTGKSGLSNCKV